MTFDKIPGIWFAVCGFIYLIGCALCIVLASNAFCLGFVSGGALVLLNLFASARKLRRAHFPNRGSVLASVVGGFYIRLAVIGICLYFLISYLKVDPIGLVLGLSVIPAGIMIVLLLIYIANRRPEEA
jgi:hypothetical protein